MLVRETVRSAWRSLVSNRMRTALTALGMIIGVAAVIAVLSIGAGAQSSVEGNIRSLGTNLLTVRPNWGRSGGVRTGSVQTLTRKDADAIAKLPGVAAVAPENGGSAQLKYREVNQTGSVNGVTASYLGVRSLSVERGIGFTELDDQQRSRVVILGAAVKRELFGSQPAVGERLQINGVAFRVVGILAEKGAGMMSPDDAVLIPLSTHQGVLFGQDHLSSINLQVTDESRSKEVEGRVTQLLRLRHRLRPDQENDFSIRSQTEMLETMSAITGVFTALLGSVAAVSLIVGGIGIMNIMLVSVRERTREIGVRMAVGARRRDVLLQFLVEAVVVSIAGGLAGIAVGYGLAFGIAKLGGWPAIVPMYGIVLALVVSAAIGIVFGVGPARRASRLDPVEALRFE